MTKILVVDDDEIVRESLCAVLREAGHETVEAADGEAGLACLRAEAFELTIVDIWMPKVDGLALLREIRQGGASLPVIIISGGGPGQTLERASAIADSYGAGEVLYKPFEDEELLEAVERAVGK